MHGLLDDPEKHAADLPDGAGVVSTFESREIGRAGSARAGATLVCVAGQHGNEPSGVFAVRRVLDAIGEHGVPMRGALVGLRGNVTALAQGVRYRAADLNRLWTPDRLERLRAKGDPIREAGHEFEEMHELFGALEGAFADATSEVAVLDLHTTSSASAPFVVMEDRLPNREHARRFGTPVVIGLEEVLNGTLPDYVNDRGFVSLGFEAGQHDAPESVDRHESAVWVMLCSMRIVDRADVPGGLGAHEARLAGAAKGLPSFVELRGHHRVLDGDAFEMRAGYANFVRVEAGELLARDRRGEVRAPARGRVFMPLYQPLGEDGFFIVRRVGAVWLKLSAALRLLGADRLAPLLPGVRRDPAHPGVLIADTRVARWFTVEVFHLLGYRRRAPKSEHEAVFSRRHDDLARAKRGPAAGAGGGGGR
ncbi:MAG: succinylglutamate desuccinylase/aspartoacylase family protein [Phycisphaerales bacterium]